MINAIRHRGLNILSNINEAVKSTGYECQDDTIPLTDGAESAPSRTAAIQHQAQFGAQQIDSVANRNAIFYEGSGSNQQQQQQYNAYGWDDANSQQAFNYSQRTAAAAANDFEVPNGSSKILEEEEFCEGISDANRIGAWQAGWNVTNAIQGMFIVSLPYGVLHGGWWGVFALVFVAYICYYTGIILVECLYDDQGKRIRNSYVDVAEACWGKTLGGRMVHIAQLIELLMTDILYVVLCGDLLAGCFPTAAMDKAGWMILSCALLLGCAFVTSLKMVSWLSFYNTISHVAINAIIFFYCLSKISHWAWAKVRWSLNINTFPTVLGIVVFSYTSHIFLPTLEGNMEDKSKFKPMLKWSHIAAAVFKGLMGLLGFLTFGDYTQQEVTNNLPSQEFKTVINFILVIKALLSYPLPYYAAAQLLEHAFFRGKPHSSFPSCFGADRSLREWGLVLRVLLVLFTLFMAITIPHFALLMGLIGSFTGCMLSFIWPCAFHLHLKRHSLPKLQYYWDATIIALGLFFGFIGIIYSSAALLRAMNTTDDYY